jgi:hypothetical protein
MSKLSMQSISLRVSAFLAATASVALSGVSPAAAAGAPVVAAKETSLTVQSVRASGDDGNVPANTLDGNAATRWSAKGNGAWISYDLGTDTPVGSIDIAWYMGSARVTTFDVQTAAAATPATWTTILAGMKSRGTNGFEHYDLTDTTSRYVRIVGHGNTQNDWVSISGVVLSGIVLAPLPVPAPAPASDAPNCVNPGQALNVTNWKVTLPTGAAEHPTEITQPALGTHPVAPWFVPTTGCTGLRFRAPVNGVTTSGSGNPRSELREMTNNGATNASWSSNSGTHTMIINEAVTGLPSVKPHVVAGQIHDAKNDISVFRVEGSNVYVTKGNDSHFALAASNYVLGTKFEAKFVVTGNVVKAYYNGKLVTTFAASFTSSYFKAGVYTQANCTNSTPCSSSNYGEVTIYGLTVTHS